MYTLLGTDTALRSVFICSVGFLEQTRIFSYAALTCCSLFQRIRVFAVRYELSPYKTGGALA